MQVTHLGSWAGAWRATGSSTALSFQGMGAMLALVASVLWTARRHLAGALRAAFGMDGAADDSDEILSYRAAVWLWLGCGIYFFEIGRAHV